MPDGASDRESTDLSLAGSVNRPEASPPHSESTESTSDALHSGDESPLSFRGENVGEQLQYASDKTLNEVDFGIIKLDDEGIVQFFNQYESELSGVTPEEAEGRSFFTEVAPCTNNRLFRGRFRKGVRRGDLDETLTYTYTYRMRPTLVDIHLYRDSSGNNWIMAKEY